MENQSKWLYVFVLIVIVALVAGYFYFKGGQKKEQFPLPEKASDPAVSGTLPSINTQAEINVPEINPVDKANPFKDVYKNPFE